MICNVHNGRHSSPAEIIDNVYFVSLNKCHVQVSYQLGNIKPKHSGIV